jgi:DNA-directed RNA polymerase subunit RPC12/RpoP
MHQNLSPQGNTSTEGAPVTDKSPVESKANFPASCIRVVYFPDTISIIGNLVHVSEQPPLTCARFDNPEMSPVTPEWYDLVTPPTCQGSFALEDNEKKEWFCSGCHATFRGRYETMRHISTAGMEVRCRYCEKAVNVAPFVLRRHVGSSLCFREWEKRGFTGERSVDDAFRAQK